MFVIEQQDYSMSLLLQLEAGQQCMLAVSILSSNYVRMRRRNPAQAGKTVID